MTDETKNEQKAARKTNEERVSEKPLGNSTAQFTDLDIWAASKDANAKSTKTNGSRRPKAGSLLLLPFIC